MTVYYLDLKNGNDSNDGTSFANRKKTVQSLTAPTGGDEIRIAGQPSTLVDANAKINNSAGDTYTSRSISITYSTTLGETSCSYSNHGMQTGAVYSFNLKLLASTLVIVHTPFGLSSCVEN